MTTPEQYAAMTDAQRYEALVRAELQRDNAEHLLREHTGKAAAHRQDAAVAAIRDSQPQSLAA